MKIRGNTVGTTLSPEANLVKATNLTDEQKAQARENIGATAIVLCTWYGEFDKNGGYVYDDPETFAYFNVAPKVNDLLINPLGQVGLVEDISVNQYNRAVIKYSFVVDLKGYTPVRGTDYWTDADKEEIKAYVDEAILGGAW